MSKTNVMEPEPEEIWDAWQEWKDGDDSELYDSGYTDGIIKAIEILDSVRAQSEVDRLPSSFTVSVVIATLRKIAQGED
jgi:hypothetical protein